MADCLRPQYEVALLVDCEPVLLCRRRLELRRDWEQRTGNFNVWKTVEPPAPWVETFATLEQATAVAEERARVLNTLASLFDSPTAVALYRRWESDGEDGDDGPRVSGG